MIEKVVNRRTIATAAAFAIGGGALNGCGLTVDSHKPNQHPSIANEEIRYQKTTGTNQQREFIVSGDATRAAFTRAFVWHRGYDCNKGDDIRKTTLSTFASEAIAGNIYYVRYSRSTITGKQNQSCASLFETVNKKFILDTAKFDMERFYGGAKAKGYCNVPEASYDTYNEGVQHNARIGSIGAAFKDTAMISPSTVYQGSNGEPCPHAEYIDGRDHS